MHKKKILVFIDWFLPGYKAGGPVQSVANMIAHLKDDFSFSVVTRNTDYCETIPYKEIISDQWSHLPDGTRVYYFSKDKLNKKNIKKIITGEQCDYVYLNGIYSFYFSILPLLIMKRNQKPETRNQVGPGLLSVGSPSPSGRAGVGLVIAARGMLAKGSLSVKKTKKKLFLKLAKTTGLFNNVIFHATNDQEAGDILQHLGRNVKIRIAPNLPSHNIENKLSVRNKEKGFLKLINIARVAPEKNLKYALEVLREVKANVIFDIFGTIYNKRYWEECLSLIRNMPSNISINYKGSIDNAQIQQLFQQYHFMFMPTTGENFGHVIFEALSAGCPVIISDKTPWINLEKKQIGWNISLEDNRRFIKIIEHCIEMKQEEYNIISKNAYNFAREFAENTEAIEQNRKLFGL